MTEDVGDVLEDLVGLGYGVKWLLDVPCSGVDRQLSADVEDVSVGDRLGVGTGRGRGCVRGDRADGVWRLDDEAHGWIPCWCEAGRSMRCVPCASFV